jgi:hypothetical protein
MLILIKDIYIQKQILQGFEIVYGALTISQRVNKVVPERRALLARGISVFSFDLVLILVVHQRAELMKNREKLLHCFAFLVGQF